MKNSKFVTSLFLFLLFNKGFSQGFSFEHTGGRAAIVSKDKLKSARILGEVIPHYATPYYKKSVDYVSVEILATCNGKATTSKGTSDSLTMEQKTILCSADMGTEIVIKINFKNKYQSVSQEVAKNDNHLNDNQIKEIEYAVTPGPDVEAEYPGGEWQVEQFLKENFSKKLNGPIRKYSTFTMSVAFTVNEEGQVTDARIAITSADPLIDKLLLDAIAKMPKWRPAENSKGAKVKQEFMLRYGTGGTGC